MTVAEASLVPPTSSGQARRRTITYAGLTDGAGAIAAGAAAAPFLVRNGPTTLLELSHAASSATPARWRSCTRSSVFRTLAR